MKYFVYIDDEKEIGELVGELYFPYKELQYKYFYDLEEAVNFIENNDIAGVLCDQNMPEGLGTEIASSFNKEIIFAIATGNINLTQDESSRSNINRVLSKPFLDEEFTNYLEFVLKNSF